MRVFIVEKSKGKIYKSESMVRTLFNYELSHDEDGAPYVEGACISISDTKNFWACSVCDHPIGIDIEEASRTVKAAVAKRLHKDERAYLSVLTEESSEWKEEFLSIWVKKEAYMKLKGEGLKMGLASFSVIDTGLAKSKKYKRLFVGYAGDSECEISMAEYDAPFEKSCLESASDMLDARMYTEAELSKKLMQKGYSKEDIDEAMLKLKDYAYINDENYAKAYAEKLARDGKGPVKIEMELVKKGIERSLAKVAAAQYKEDQKPKALDAAQKVLKNVDLKSLEREEREKYLAKVARKLSSLGYESGVIYDTIDKLRL